MANVATNCGIYCITNTVSGKFYIGSSTNLTRRKIHHFSELRLNDHHCRHLQFSFNKHGEENFTFSVLEFIVNEDLLIEKEQEWFDAFAHDPLLMNSSLNAKGGRSGFKIEQVDKKGDVVKVWRDSSYAARQLGFNQHGIFLCVTGKCKTYKGFVWRFVSKEKREKAEQVRKSMELCFRVAQYDVDGNFIAEYPSAVNAAMVLGKKSSDNISLATTGKHPKAYGFQWRRIKKGDNPPIKIKGLRKIVVVQCLMSGEEVQRFYSVAKAAKSVGGNGSLINRCLKGEAYTHKGFKWINPDPEIQKKIDKIIAVKSAIGKKNFIKAHREKPKKYTAQKVKKYSLEGEFIEEFQTAFVAAETLGNMNKRRNIENVCKGRRKSAYGFYWRYAP